MGVDAWSKGHENHMDHGATGGWQIHLKLLQRHLLFLDGGAYALLVVADVGHNGVEAFPA